jgi:hypothetical protein
MIRGLNAGWFQRRKRWLVAAPFIIAAGTSLMLGAAPAAFAASATSQVCAQNGTGYCMNDWGGSDFPGDDVNMYTNNNTHNNDFAIEAIEGCVGPNGAVCAVVEYLPSNGALCLAGTTAGGESDFTGGLASCGDIAHGGNGADLGVIQWLTSPSWCHGGVGLENRYWSQHLNNPVYVQSGGSIGSAVNLEGDAHTGTSCWGQVP